jgi:hypothetical protein
VRLFGLPLVHLEEDNPKCGSAGSLNVAQKWRRPMRGYKNESESERTTPREESCTSTIDLMVGGRKESREKER